MSLGKRAKVFQVEVYTILTCVLEIDTQNRPQNCVSI
jgi:hypothetical protein